MTSLPDYVEFRKFPGIPLKDIFSAAGDDLLDMLDRLLDCDPSGRVNATQVQYNSLRIRASSVDGTNTGCELWLCNGLVSSSGLSDPS